METIPAVLTVAGSYLGYLLAWRRVRVARGRRAGPEPELVERYDHAALAAELADVRKADETAPGGDRVVPIPSGPLGTLPPVWSEAPWSFASPSRLAGARDRLVQAMPAEAAVEAVAAGAPPEAVRSLFTWAFLHRLFGGELRLAAEVAEVLRTLDPDAEELFHRLLARLETVRAEVAGPGPEREAACTAALGHLRRSGVRGEALPAEAGLAAHLDVLRLSFWDLEWRELAVRRRLRRAMHRHPQAPVLHLVRAQLAARLGDGEGASDWLARALYYARGDLHYARTILASPWLARVRPALVAQARALVADAASGHPPFD